jgi:dCMP deaminase
MKCAEAFAECSSSTRLQVGTVIVKGNRIISCGYNALPEHISGPLEDEYGNTKSEVRHSEMNALNGLMRSGETSIGATLICTHSCCKMCAIDIVDSGIDRVIYKHEYRDSSGLDYLKNHGVQVVKYEGLK